MPHDNYWHKCIIRTPWGQWSSPTATSISVNFHTTLHLLQYHIQYPYIATCTCSPCLLRHHLLSIAIQQALPILLGFVVYLYTGLDVQQAPVTNEGYHWRNLSILEMHIILLLLSYERLSPSEYKIIIISAWFMVIPLFHSTIPFHSSDL